MLQVLFRCICSQHTIIGYYTLYILYIYSGLFSTALVKYFSPETLHIPNLHSCVVVAVNLQMTSRGTWRPRPPLECRQVRRGADVVVSSRSRALWTGGTRVGSRLSRTRCVRSGSQWGCDNDLYWIPQLFSLALGISGCLYICMTDSSIESPSI